MPTRRRSQTEQPIAGPSRPTLASLFTPEPEVQQTPKSSLKPTLDSLFTPPPPSTKTPGSRVHFTDPVVTPTSKAKGKMREESQSSSTLTVTSTKGKGRMIKSSSRTAEHMVILGEEILPDTLSPGDSKTHFSWLRHHWTGMGSPYACKLCIAAGGERAEKAIYCRGRDNRKFCRVEADLMVDSEKDHGDKTASEDEESMPSLSRSQGGRRKRASVIMAMSSSVEPSLPPSSPLFGLESTSARLGLSAVEDLSPPHRPRGRPREYPLVLPMSDSAGSISALPDKSSSLPASPANYDSSSPSVSHTMPRRPRGRPRKIPIQSTPDTSGVELSPFVSGQSVAKPQKITRPSTSTSHSRRTAISEEAPKTLPKSRQSLPPLPSARQFSQPRNQIIFSSDPMDSDSDSEDEMNLRDSEDSFPPSSPPFSMSSPPRSSSPSYEIRVRAKDAGIVLGEHSGRLPVGMVDALSGVMSGLGSSSLPTPPNSTGSDPSLSTFKPTLGSMRKSPYVLPTPPRSFGSARSPSTSFTTSNSKGLMLPPPIPRHLPTPAPSETPPPTNRVVQIMTSPMKRVREEDHSLNRSKSVASFKRASSSSLHKYGHGHGTGGGIVSLPKKNRLERDLAKLAMACEDDDGLEWGMDEEAGLDLGRSYREGSVVKYL